MNAPFPDPGELLGPLPARREVRKAVILAAGRGRRMGKLTKDRPKAALEVAGHALLDWQIAALRRAGVEQIAVVTGHGAEALAGRDVDYIHNANWNMGTQVDTLLCAKDWIGGEPVIVSYSDILYHPSAALALLERPGDIVIAYDADHRWLWKRRFGDWLKDSETFRLAPGQVLSEIGGRPTDIEEVEGQFMGLMALTSSGLRTLTRLRQETTLASPASLDFTASLARLIAAGERIDTASNILPWMEVDCDKDLLLAQQMAVSDELKGTPPQLIYPGDIVVPGHEGETSAIRVDARRDHPEAIEAPDYGRCAPEPSIQGRHVVGAFAIQNWGRSGSTFVQSLFDDHPQVLSTPNFYSRAYYLLWARHIALVPDAQKIALFLAAFRQWWDPGFVDATAGLHRLGPERRELAGVDQSRLENFIREALPATAAITRRSLLCAAHLAYAFARGQTLDSGGLQILYPIHGRPRGIACAFLEDFPNSRFIHTVRNPATNIIACNTHAARYHLHRRRACTEGTLTALFAATVDIFAGPTLFGTRAYLSHLVLEDHARFLRLEDLHANGSKLMARTAEWLGLRFHENLCLSSWDGKRWWNRPESGADSMIGGASALHMRESTLGSRDLALLSAISESCFPLSCLYPTAAPAHFLGRCFAVVRPWTFEKAETPHWFRCLQVLLPLWPIATSRLKGRVLELLKREVVRARLLEMSEGVSTARKRLPPQQLSDTLDVVLLLRQVGNEWRSRVFLRKVSGDTSGPLDQLSVGFFSDATKPSSASDAIIHILALIVGRPTARLSTFISVRRLMAQLAFHRAKLSTRDGLGVLTVEDLLSR